MAALFGRRRPGGICGSPVSSDDEQSDVFAYDDPDDDDDVTSASAGTNQAAKAMKTTKKTTKATKPTATTATATTKTTAPRKRRRGAETTAADAAGASKAPRVLNKKELVRAAPQRFVEYLADQLAPDTQAQFCEEFGAGQGVMLKPPTAWSEVRERREFGEWATKLGFVASTVHRHLYRISSLNVEIVLGELRTRVRIRSDRTSFPLDADVTMNFEVDAEPEPHPTETSTSKLGDVAKPVSSKREYVASLLTAKEHFQRLDEERLEMLSVSEHDRLLSTIRHEQIADAMEEVLARPSVRKNRDRARRMSKLGRIAERRLSIIPMRPSMLPPTIMEDDEWDEDEEDGEGDDLLQGPETILEEDETDLLDDEIDEQLEESASTAEPGDEEDSSMVTPQKSSYALRERRSSIGSVGTPTRRMSFGSASASPTRSSVRILSTTPAKTPGAKPPLTPIRTPMRSPAGKPAAVLRTPMQTPKKTPKKTQSTPNRTPMRTPRRSSLSAFGPRRSSISKIGVAELKRWRVVGRNVLGSLFRSGFLGAGDLKAAFNVSRVWREFAIPAYAWCVADYSNQSSVLEMERIYAECPRGHYLSDGAYKEVFKVFSTRHKRLEAVSVMDIRSIESTGNQHIVRQEVAHSLLLSELVRSRFSPHFVEIYDVFLARERPHTLRWGNATCRKPVDLLTGGRNPVDVSVVPGKTPRSADDLFQYIRMEFCDGGDVEDFIALQEDKLLPVNSVVLPFFFQMVFGVYSARERFNLRHCDIKLLNFFLKDISRKGLKCAQDEPLTLQYCIGDDAFNVRMPATFSYWVKLADYGTADSSLENLGKPVSLDQFTTLENTPVEFLMEGDHAQQSYAADTFSLGLCLLHLFTGSAPYEEILEDVRCPVALAQDLKRLWMAGKKNSPFSVLRRVGQDDSEDVLTHTLYRYIVLFGLPSENPSANKQNDRVWTLLIKHLRPEDVTENQSVRQSSRRAAAAAKNAATKSATDQFQDDRARYSIACGSHPIIKRARDRMARVAGAQELLLSLVDFNPSERPTMKRTLFHDVFKTMRVTSTGNGELPRPVHYTIDCYSCEKYPVDRLPDV